MTNAAEVIETALALPQTDRSYIASKLIESLESEELSPQGIREYDGRMARWKSGETKTTGSRERDSKVRDLLNL